MKPVCRHSLRTGLLAFQVLLAAAAGRAQSVDIAPYAWEFPFVTGVSLADPLVSELRSEVQRILDAGRLAPLYVSFSDQESVGYTVYQEPGRIITTLAWAYPYLDSAQQSAVRAYVNAEFNSATNSPWGVTSYGKNGNSNYPLPHFAGTPREDHPKAAWWFANASFANARPFLQTLYGVWLYGYRTGDWQAASNHWSAIRQLYSNYGSDDAYRLYGTMNVHVAMARLADQFGDATTRTTALSKLQAGLNAGLDLATVESLAQGSTGYEWRSPYGSFPNMYDSRMDDSTYHGWIFLNLSPELGRYLHDASPTLLAAVLARHASGKATFPLWWMPKASYFNRSWTGDEGSGSVPEVVGMLAPVERWVLQAAPATLRLQTRGAPNGVGDCYWLEALVQAIEAQGTLRWYDVRLAAGPPPVLSSVQAAIPGTFQFRVEGLAARSYAVEVSGDLQSWSPVYTNPSGSFTFGETNFSGAGPRFYRARLVPGRS